MPALTSGAIEALMEGQSPESPVLQVLGHKGIVKGGTQADRYRLLLSDGVNSISTAMLATQMNHLVEEGQITKYSVIKLNKFSCAAIQPEKRILILLEVEVLGTEPGTIGNPQSYQKTHGEHASGAPPATNGHAGSSAAGASGGDKKSFYGNAAAQNPNVSRVQGNAGGAFGNKGLPQTPGGSIPKVYPIESLTPYQNRWTIRARVTQKSNIRTWSNSRGEGKLFSMNLLDESGEIRATAFTQEVDKFHDMIEVNKVYYITKGTLKPANKQYCSLNNDYEMTFTRETQVTPCEEAVDLPSIKFDFVPINTLGEKQPNSLLDVIGVVQSTADISSIMTKKDNREVKKRDVELVDQSAQMIRMTLWGSEAETFDGSSHPVVAIKGARLSDFGGRSLSCLGSSQLLVNPDIGECHQLRGWYDSVGHSLDFNTFYSEGMGSGGGSSASWKMFADVLDENLGHSDKADYFTTKGTVAFLKKDNCMYTACPSAECNKKLIDNSNGTFRCEKCNKEFDNFKWRMILQINLVDCSGSQWVTCFQESAETILGCTADQLGELKSSGDDSAFEKVFSDASFKQFVFRLRAKTETYNDEERLKVICVSASPINFVELNARLLQDIESLNIGTTA